MKEFGLFSDSWLLFLRKVRIEKDYVKKGIRQLEVMDFQAIVGVIQCCGSDFKLDVDQQNPLGGGHHRRRQSRVQGQLWNSAYHRAATLVPRR